METPGKMQKALAIFLAIGLWALLGTGWAARPSYLVTIPPLSMLLAPVVGSIGRVLTLLPAGASPATYEPRPSDARRALKAMAFFYVADDVDGWAAKLQSSYKIEMLPLVPRSKLHPWKFAGARKAGAALRLSDYNPHFWMDPLVVKAMLPSLVDRLCSVDAEHCTGYHTNAAKFAGRLDKLNLELTQILKPVKGRPVLLFHPSMVYMLDQYGLDYAGAIEPFPGKEPTPRHLQDIMALIKKLGVRAVFTEPQLNPRPAEVVAEAAKVKVYVLDPLGGVPGRESYAELLLYNAHELAKALH